MEWGNLLELGLRLVVPFVGALAVLVALGWWRGRRSRRALISLAETRTTRLRVVVRGDAPYPNRFRRAWFEVAEDGAVLRCDGAQVDVRLPAGPLRVVRTRLGGRRDALPFADTTDYVVVHLLDGAGTRVEIAVTDEEEHSIEVLHAIDVLLGPPSPQVVDKPARSVVALLPSWSKGVAVAGLVAGAFVATLWATAAPVAVTVLEPADEYDYCAVGWQDPFDGVTARQAEISCYEEQPGDAIAGLALDRPFRGEIFDVESFPILLGLAGVLLAVALGGTAIEVLATRRRVRRRAATGHALSLDEAGPAASSPDLPDLGEDDLRLALVAEVAQRRAAIERWDDTGSTPPTLVTPAEAVGRPWWSRLASRSIVLSRAGLAAGALVPLGIGVIGGWSSATGWLGSQGATETARAEVADVSDFFPFFPADLEVTFEDRWGATQSTFVALVGDAPPGTVTVRYAVEAPERARLVGEGDGTGRGLLLGVGLVASALGWIAWHALQARRISGGITRALREGAESSRPYVLVHDPENDPVLLLFEDEQGPPRWALPLAEPVAAVVPLTGTAQLRGDVSDGAVVVAVVDGKVLWPISPLVEIDPEFALLLVTGDLGDDGDDWGDDD